MDLVSQLEQAVSGRALYPIVAVLLTLVLQVAKVSPYTKVLYAKVPVGWRWLTPVVAGGVVGFVRGYQQGSSVACALVEMLLGMFGVGATSMGVHAGLTESPIPWNGDGKGGVPLPKKSDQ